jgi:predicted nucleic acid-binding protein
MYLLDTNVVSELRKLKPHGAVVAWMSKVSDTSIALSAVTIGEIQAGIEITREQDKEKAKQLENWLNQVESVYNVIPLNAQIFRRWGKIMHRQSNTILEDGLIAATAIENNLTVVTRDEKDFKRFKVNVLNPFK